MTQIDRYIVKRLLGWLLLSQFCASFLFLTTQISRLSPLFMGTEHSVDVWKALIWVQIPVWGWALGPAVVIALFSVAASMGRRGEMTAIESAGVSRVRLLRWPAILIACLFGVSCWGWLTAAPWAHRRLQHFVESSLAGAVTNSIVPGQLIEPMENVVVYVDKKNSAANGANTYSGVMFSRAVAGKTQLAVSETATMKVADDAPILRVALDNGELFNWSGRMTVLRFKQLRFELSIDDELHARMDFLPLHMGIPTRTLWQRQNLPNIVVSQSFELYRRVAKPIEFLLLAIISLCGAFLGNWKSRAPAFGAALLLYAGIHLTARAAEVAMTRGLLFPAAAAFMSSAVLLAVGICVGFYAVGKNK